MPFPGADPKINDVFSLSGHSSVRTTSELTTYQFLGHGGERTEDMGWKTDFYPNEKTPWTYVMFMSDLSAQLASHLRNHPTNEMAYLFTSKHTNRAKQTFHDCSL
jgi:hypothetical protein